MGDPTRPTRHHWFEDLADHLGAAYLRYSFTRGTEQEVAFLVDALGLQPGMSVLDIGCGPGRHAHALGRRGVRVVGVDIAERFVTLADRDAPPGVAFVRADARALPVTSGRFDAAVSLCQGAFGLVGPGQDLVVLGEIARALAPRGRAAVSAFSSYFQVRWLEQGTTFDAAAAVHHERTTIKNEAGDDAEVDLWTTCYTPRELELLLAATGLDVEAIWSVEPGRYTRSAPSIETPEFLVIARKARW